MKHIGKNIKTIITEKKISVKEIAAILNITPNHIYKILASESVESHYLITLSEYLSVPISSFFGEESTNELEILSKKIDELQIKYNSLLVEKKLLEVELDNTSKFKNLYENIAEYAKKESTNYSNIIGLMFTDLLRLKALTDTYVEKVILSDNPGLLDKKNKSLFKKYIESDELARDFKVTLNKTRSIIQGVKGLKIESIPEDEKGNVMGI